MTDIQFVMKPQNKTIEQLVQDCAEGELSFDDLCQKIAAMGYKTTYLHEMVLAVAAQKPKAVPMPGTKE